MCEFDKDFANSSEVQFKLKLLNSAIQKRDNSLLVSILKEESVDVLNFNHDGWYPLHEAINLGHVDIAKLLIEYASKHGINVLKKWDQTMTFHPKYSCNKFMTIFITPSPQVSFLALAVKNNQLNLINYLINLYQNNCEYNQGIYTAMLESIDLPEILEVLLNAFPFYIDKCFENFQSLIQYAIEVNHVESVSVLLKFKPNLNAALKVDYIYPIMSVDLYTLAMACKSDDTRILKLLIDTGSCLFRSSQNTVPVNLLNPVVKSPILFATVWGSTEVVKFLVENEFDVLASQAGYFSQTDSPKAQFKISAIFLAIIHKKYETFNYLLTVVDKEKLGKLQQISPVIAAVIRRVPKALKLLLEYGYNIDGTLPHAKLHYFCGDNMLDNVTMFIDDMEDVHRPVLSILKCLLGSGVKFTSVINAEFLEYCLFYLEEISHETMKYLVNVGALEFVFGHNSYIKAMKSFFNEQKNYIIMLLTDDFVQHPRQAWVKAENVHVYINNFNVFVQHTGLFNEFTKQYPYISEGVPSLKQLCKLVIRCCIIQKHKTLLPIREQQWPLPLVHYLLCSQ